MAGGGQQFGGGYNPQPYGGGYNQQPYGGGYNQQPYGGGFGIGQFSGGPGSFSTPQYGGSQGGFSMPYSPYGSGYGNQFSYAPQMQQSNNPYSYSTPMQQGSTAADLDATTQGYNDRYTAYQGMGGSEEDFLKSSDFRGFESDLLGQISNLNDTDRLRSDLDQQTARAREGGVYSASAGRIASGLQRRLNALQQAPRRQETYPSPYSFMPQRRSQYNPYYAGAGQGNQFNQMMGFGLGGMGGQYGQSRRNQYGQSGPGQYGSSMFANIPNYFTRQNNSPALYGTTNYGSGLGSIGADSAQGVDPITGQSTLPSPQDLADKTFTAGSLYGIQGLQKKADGTYTYRLPGGAASAFGDFGLQEGFGTFDLPSNTDLSQLPGFDQALFDSGDTGTLDSQGNVITRSPGVSDGSVDLKSFGSDNEALTNQFTLEMEAFGGGEAAFATSPRFWEFENRLINTYIGKPTADIRAEAERQLARSQAEGGNTVYAQSARRIYDRLNAYAVSKGSPSVGVAGEAPGVYVAPEVVTPQGNTDGTSGTSGTDGTGGTSGTDGTGGTDPNTNEVTPFDVSGIDLTGEDIDGINSQYSSNYAQAMASGMTEEEWVNSGMFGNFESALITEFMNMTDPDAIEAEADRQSARTGLYAGSGQRIAEALRYKARSLRGTLLDDFNL